MSASPLRWNLLVLAGLAALFGTSVITAYEPYTFLHGDGSFYATMNRSLMDGTLVQRGYQPSSWYELDMGWNRDIDAGWTNISLGADGKTWYPKHPVVMPLLSTPLFALASYDGLLAFNVLCLTLGLWCAFRIASRYAGFAAAACAVLGMAALPVFTRNAYCYSNDVMYAAMVVGAWERWLAGRFSTSGLLLGMAIWAKATNVVLGLPLGVALLLGRRWRPALRMVLGASGPIAVNLAMNAVMFGGPFVTAYHRILVMSGGHQELSDITERFGRSFGAGWTSVWGDAHEGLRHNAGLGLLGIAGLPWWARKAPALAASFVVSLAGFLLIYLPFEYTYARFFLPWAMLLLVPLALLLGASVRGVEGLGARLGRVGRSRLWGGVCAGVLVLAVAAVPDWAAMGRWRAADHITEARVERVGARENRPCDYFNLRHVKFECAMAEPQVWHRWGLAVGPECRFSDGSDGWLWLHPNPGVAKTITFEPPPGPVVIRYGLAPRSRHVGVRFAVKSDGRLLRELRVDAIDAVRTLTLPAAERGRTLTVEVPRQAYDWRQLCVAIEVGSP